MTYSNGLGGRHRNGDKRRPAHDQARASVGGNRTSLLTEPASDPWMMDGQDLDWPGNPPPPPQGNYPYPAAPSGGGAASYRGPAPQYQGPRQRLASGPAPVEPARPRPGNTGPMPPYGHPSGPLRQYSPPAGPRTVDSVRLANQILSTANYQADELRNEAQGQAAAALTEARQEADALLQQAADRAAATLATAEQEAAEIRAAVMKLSAELGGVVSAYVTENLLSPARPAVLPATTPDSQPAAQSRTNQPRTTPNDQLKPTATPGARSAGKPSARSRQYVAVRAMSIFTAALVLFALTAGASEVALHGFKFFVFRSAGVGQTSGSGLQENQGPGQPDAVGAHR
jgi:hypothetical protein